MNLLVDLAFALLFGSGPLLWIEPDRPVADAYPYCMAAGEEVVEHKAPQLYEVKLQMPQMSPTLRMPAGGTALVAVADAKSHGDSILHVHVTPAAPGCVNVELLLHKSRPGCGGPQAPVIFRGGQTVDLDTVTGMVLASGEDTEPCCAQVTVRTVKPSVACPVPPTCPCPTYHMAHPQAPCMPPAPMNVTMPTHTGFMPQPMPMPAPSRYLQHPPQYFPPSPPYPLARELASQERVAPKVQLCTTTMPCPVCPATHVQLRSCCGKSRLEMKGDGCSTTCVRLAVSRGQTGTLSMAAGKKHVHVKGTKWKACADQIDIYPDGRVVLSGHVKLMSDKIGVCASVKAEKLCVQVKHGCLDRIVEH
jgi:hypothetical protein